MKIDLGDVTLRIDAVVRGLRRFRVRWHVGVPFDTTPADRTVRTPVGVTSPLPRKDLIMDLQADKQVPLSVEWTDEVGNPLSTPAGATAVYTVDDPSIIALTDHGDGTAVAAAMGVLGTATVHGVFTADGMTLTGDLQIVVVAGLAERVNIFAGDPVEVTPDV